MSGQYRCGVKLTCSGCKKEQNLYTPGFTRDWVEMWMRLLTGTISEKEIPAESPVGKSQCCKKQMSGELFGY